MPIVWMRAGRLAVDADGQLWERYRRGWHFHGPIADAIPPEGTESAYRAIREAWDDRFDPRIEQLMFWE